MPNMEFYQSSQQVFCFKRHLTKFFFSVKKGKNEQHTMWEWKRAQFMAIIFKKNAINETVSICSCKMKTYAVCSYVFVVCGIHWFERKKDCHTWNEQKSSVGMYTVRRWNSKEVYKYVCSVCVLLCAVAKWNMQFYFQFSRTILSLLVQKFLKKIDVNVKKTQHFSETSKECMVYVVCRMQVAKQRVKSKEADRIANCHKTHTQTFIYFSYREFCAHSKNWIHWNIFLMLFIAIWASICVSTIYLCYMVFHCEMARFSPCNSST